MAERNQLTPLPCKWYTPSKFSDEERSDVACRHRCYATVD